MAISYDDWKKQYEGMTTEQQKNYANMVKGNATATEYANRYIQEKQNAGTFGTQTANSYTNANQSTNTSTSTNNYQNSYSNNNSNGNNSTINPTPRTQEEINKSISDAQNRMRNGERDMTMEEYRNQQNQQFDPSRLTNQNAQVTVKQGTAAQTGLPDYQDNSDAREQEIVNNLNAYWNNPANKSFFADRATFNSTFHYDERNDRQKAILDSFWKGTENYNKATSYTDGKSFSTALNSGNVTEAQYAGMKDWNPEVFKEWQEQLKEEMNLAISNLSKITTNYDNAEILQTMMEKLGIEPQQGRDIIGGWEEMMDRTGAWSAMKDATKARESYNAVADKMTSIMNRYSSSTGGTQSDALVAARLQKALAPYQQQAQNYYSAWQMANTEFQTKLGTANNYASTIQAQAAEDQRIFQQKLSSLGFAMTVNSYRTPEQQAALQLQTQQIQNNMALYQQSRLNELSLYNQKQLNDLNLQYQEDLTKLQNKLSYELKDLSVEDPEQLKANLNNILTDYFSKYGDIIQRSQSQVIDDVIAYAKEHGISVAQALKENFIDPLQNKPEYKQAVGTGIKESYGKIGDTNVKFTQNPDGTISYEVIGDIGTNSYGGGGIGTMRTERNNNPTAMTTDVAKSLGGIEGVDYEVGDSFTTGDGRTLYTAKLIGDPIEKTIELLDRGVSKGAGFKTQKGANRWTYLSQIGINDEKWKGMNYEEKKNVVLKMLQHEGGDINKMLYYNTKQDKDWSNDQYIDYYTMDFEALNKLTDQTKRDIKDHYGSWDKFLEARKQYNEEVIKPQGTKEGNDVLIAMAQLQNLIGRDATGKLTGKLDTSYSMFSPGNAAGRKLAQLQSLLKLNKLQEAKRGGASFGGMTEGEWTIIGDASTSLSNWLSDEDFKDEFYSVAKAVYKATYGKPLDSNTWMNFVNKYYDGTNSLDLTGPDNNV